ncbi:tyrosine-type recombinase/integrase [Bifidobacterium apri]|uniref:Phage integrase family protein n=1 Tax=Bifidobacterium apri TaxID=1769423 RepID=A0A6A2VSY9_9BIFI|nr:site-specific integrase [Bifidobacterium apri]KAB8290577.1 phage integrase family protein [Bifidobacterium apri]
MPRKARSGIIHPYKVVRSKKLKDGTVREYVSWEAKVDGRRVSARTYRQCDEKIRGLLAERSELGVAGDPNIRFGAYLDTWLEGKRDTVDPGTFKMYKVVVRTHLAPYGNLRLSRISPQAVRRILGGLTAHDRFGNDSGRPLGFGGKRRVYGVLGQVFKQAVAERVVAFNPMLGVPVPRARDADRDVERVRTAFTVPELERLLGMSSRLGVPDGAVWWVLLLTGMRLGEMLGLTWDCVDLDGGFLRVDWKLEHVAREHGCGEPDSGGVYPCGYKLASKCPRSRLLVPSGFDCRELDSVYCLTRPKSHTGRVVPLVPELVEVLRRVKMIDPAGGLEGLVFHRPDGHPLSPTTVERLFRELCREAGVADAEHRVVHETRHSVVTLLFALGVDSGLVQEIVGHSSAAMSEHYRHAGLGERSAAMNRLEDGLGLRRLLPPADGGE